jgi:hypothetical protein
VCFTIFFRDFDFLHDAGVSVGLGLDMDLSVGCRIGDCGFGRVWIWLSTDMTTAKAVNGSEIA